MQLTYQSPANFFKTAIAPSVFEIGNLMSSMPLRRGERVNTRQQDRFSIVWVISGKSSCAVDRLEYGLGNNQLICLGPGKEFHLDVDDPAQGYIIHFSPSFLQGSEQTIDLHYQDDLYRLFSTPVALTVKEDMAEEMKGIASRMLTESENLFLYKSQILRRYLKIFLIYLSRHEVRKEQPTVYTRSSQLVQKFMMMLEKEFKTVKSVNEYASQLAVTPNHLNVIVKKYTRYSAGHHIRQRVVLEAKRLAIYSDACMKEIAYLLGFSDTAHFSKFFKKSTGVNFSEFKRSREPEALIR